MIYVAGYVTSFSASMLLDKLKRNTKQKAYEYIKQCIQGRIELLEALKTMPSGHEMSFREA